MKDAVYLTNLGYNSIAPNGEAVLLEDEVIADLKQRFDNVYLLFDSDGTFNPENKGQGKGKEASLRSAQAYDIPYMLIPDEYEEKDITDFHLAHGKQESKKLIQNLMNNACNGKENTS